MKLTMDQAVAVYAGIPVGEAKELPLEDGWKQWDAAVALMDSQAMDRARFVTPEHQPSVGLQT